MGEYMPDTGTAGGLLTYWLLFAIQILCKPDNFSPTAPYQFRHRNFPL